MKTHASKAKGTLVKAGVLPHLLSAKVDRVFFDLSKAACEERMKLAAKLIKRNVNDHGMPGKTAYALLRALHLLPVQPKDSR